MNRFDFMCEIRFMLTYKWKKTTRKKLIHEWPINFSLDITSGILLLFTFYSTVLSHSITFGVFSIMIAIFNNTKHLCNLLV